LLTSHELELPYHTSDTRARARACARAWPHSLIAEHKEETRGSTRKRAQTQGAGDAR
jgi:hypothetical protein